MTDPTILKERVRVGNLLRLAREDLMLTQEELAKKIGIQQSTVAKIESGSWSFSIDMITRFCTVLGRRVDLTPKI